MRSAATVSHDSHASQVSPFKIIVLILCNEERLQTNWSRSDLIRLRRFTAYSRGFTLHSSLCCETIISVKDDSDGAAPACLLLRND